jgi:hypothetical protein
VGGIEMREVCACIGFVNKTEQINHHNDLLPYRKQALHLHKNLKLSLIQIGESQNRVVSEYLVYVKESMFTLKGSTSSKMFNIIF